MPSIVENKLKKNWKEKNLKIFVSKNKFQKEKKQIVIFGESNSRGIKLHEFNYWFYKSFAQLNSFPGGTSKEPTLKDKGLTQLYCTLVLMIRLKIKVKIRIKL